MTDITIETIAQDPASRSLKVTVATEHLALAERRAVKQYAKSIRLPGFRKGHVPEKMIRSRFGAEIRQFVLEDALRESWQRALTEQELKPTADPQIRNVSFEEGNPLQFEMLVEVQPSITLERTGGFNLTRTVEPVTDADVGERLARIQEQGATWTPVTEAVRPKEGQLVTVTVENLDGDTPATPPSPHSLVLGQGQAIPALEERILEMLPGETAEAELRIPDDHPDESRRGQVRRVRLTLHEAKEQVLPALDDALAREVGEFATLDELKAAIRADLEADAVRTADARLRDQLIQQLAEANAVPAPPTLVARMVDAFARSYQVEPAQAEAFAQAFTPVAEAQVRRTLILETVAAARNLRATEEEIDERVAQMAVARGMETGKLYAQLEQQKRLHDLEHQITEEKAMGSLLAESTITEGAA
jgi:trigger factor